jgi:hypothetical protein
MKVVAHEFFVDRWLATRIGKRPPPERAAVLLLLALHALRTRTRASLGEVTLTAIFQRVLETTRRLHPSITDPAFMKGNAWTLPGTDTIAIAIATRPEELARATRHVIIELLSVLGRLTGEALTPVLYAELDRTDPSAEAAHRSSEEPVESS